MLEFIVLGLIPGTSVQITFMQVLVVAGVLALASELRIVSQRRNLVSELQRFINNISL